MPGSKIAKVVVGEDAMPKSAGLEKRVSALEAKIVELEAKVTGAVKRVEQVTAAIAEGRMDTL